MKKSVRIIVAVVLTIAMFASMNTFAFAAREITVDDAVELALRNANLSRNQVMMIETDFDDGYSIEVEFMKRSNGAEYSFEFTYDGTLVEKSVDYNRRRVFGRATISKSQARARVAKFGGFKSSTVSNGYTELEYDDGEAKYDIYFETETWMYEYEVHGRTGRILEFNKQRKVW